MNPEASSRKPISILTGDCSTFIVKNHTDADTVELPQKTKPNGFPGSML